MFHVFNMGLGMVAVVPLELVELALATLANDAYLVGEIVASDGSVKIVG
jgi:phosphoribosylaminoimidazole (AIR) synthetase